MQLQFNAMQLWWTLHLRKMVVLNKLYGKRLKSIGIENVQSSKVFVLRNAKYMIQLYFKMSNLSKGLRTVGRSCLFRYRTYSGL